MADQGGVVAEEHVFPRSGDSLGFKFRGLGV